MALLRSLLFALLFYPGTLGYVLASLAVAPFGQRPLRRVIRGWADYHHWLVTRIVGIRFAIEGEMPPGPYLIACKHEAMVETVEILRLADTPVVVLKRELADLPLFGAVARRFGVIPVDREAGAKALREMLMLGRKAIADARPVAIFPEGTRVAPDTEAPLRPGFAGLYRALGLPVVPIALASGRLWGRGFVKRAGTIPVRIGTPIEAGLRREEIEQRVRAAINAAGQARS